eukprot:TRINITY_DN3004_c2_g1_i2.p1 TRINITY_DN3004_c2_g1~~TRINITY_DN3004_c2_g1_i2.p1  ORF type:complete len:412 (+),score=98.85 TRINITY_DN3004_c2_g1_i2:104-1237(+)
MAQRPQPPSESPGAESAQHLSGACGHPAPFRPRNPYFTPDTLTNLGGSGAEGLIADVWADGLERAFQHIRQIAERYPCVAVAVEDPGDVARPTATVKGKPPREFYYQTICCNVNLLKPVQLGLTLSDREGRHPPGVCTWQFNFKFPLYKETYLQERVELLGRHGYDFARSETQGIEVEDFAGLLISSGLLLEPCGSDAPVRWLAFGAGWAFAFLLKMLTGEPLPAGEEQFFELMRTYFPDTFDVESLAARALGDAALGGGVAAARQLSIVADRIQVERVGGEYQGGSDSLLTSHCFFQLARTHFCSPERPIRHHACMIYGLGDRPYCLSEEHHQGLPQGFWGVTIPLHAPDAPAAAVGSVPARSPHVPPAGHGDLHP